MHDEGEFLKAISPGAKADMDGKLLKRRIVVFLLILLALLAAWIWYSHCGGVTHQDPRMCVVREGKKAMRVQEVENLAKLARELRVLARRYKENGENRKAQRAIGAAQELDKKIARLLEGK